MTNKEITIAEVIAPHVARYNDMWQKFQNGQITTDEWVAFCRDYFDNVILTDPVVVGVMTRLKNR